jgi:GSH-dependent disulfide-bond oxidoreductase
MIEFYYWPTPNGKKVTILLEELALPYTLKPVDIGRGDQFGPDFLRISPNNRMPALVDSEPAGGGPPVTIFESGAIMMYLAEGAARFWPREPHKKYDVVQWIMWQMANQGPKFGEQGHFTRASQIPAIGDLSYAIRRFNDEVHRLFGVMNLGLFEKRWLAADEYTIADMICYPWAAAVAVRDGRASRRAQRHGGRGGASGGPRNLAPGRKGAPPQAPHQPARHADPEGMGEGGVSITSEHCDVTAAVVARECGSPRPSTPASEE